MTFSNASENLLYLQHAKVSVEYCEKQGFTVQPALQGWQDKHRPLFTEALRVMRLEAQKRGLSPAEQDGIVGDALVNHRRASEKQVARNGVDCKNFPGVLAMYDALLKR
ncbi:MAG: hypothetical protein V4542_15160 [Pseudomonadota bacterium]